MTVRVLALQNDRPYKMTVHINHVVAQVPLAFVVETYSFYYRTINERKSIN